MAEGIEEPPVSVSKRGRFLATYPQLKSILALVLSLIAVSVSPTYFAFGRASTYDASGSMGGFRNLIIIALVFYCLTFLTRWLVIPGLIVALLGFLAIGTYVLAVVNNAGFSVIIAPLIAFAGLVYAFFCGFTLLRRAHNAEVPPIHARPPDHAHQKQEQRHGGATASLTNCVHCHEEFDFLKADRRSGPVYDSLMCPYCGKFNVDTIHPDCPYWKYARCIHDPSYRTTCSLPTHASWRTCSLV